MDANALIASMTPVGYDIGGTESIPVSQMDVTAPAQASYKIPPAFWMIAFLVIGYFGLRMLLED